MMHVKYVKQSEVPLKPLVLSLPTPVTRGWLFLPLTISCSSDQNLEKTSGKMVPAAFLLSDFLGNLGQVCASVSLCVKKVRPLKDRPCSRCPVMVRTLRCQVAVLSVGGKRVHWGSLQVIVFPSFSCSWNPACSATSSGLGQTQVWIWDHRGPNYLGLRVAETGPYPMDLSGENGVTPALTLGCPLEYLWEELEPQVGSSFLKGLQAMGLGPPSCAVVKSCR